MKPNLCTTAFCIFTVILFAAGCGLAPAATLNPPAAAPSTPESRPVPTQRLPAATAAPSAAPTPAAEPAQPSPVPTHLPPTAAAAPTELAVETYMAYVHQDALLVTHVLAGQPLETKKYAQSTARGGILSLGWSPSGKFLAFGMYESSFTHLFVVNLQEEGSRMTWALPMIGPGRLTASCWPLSMNTSCGCIPRPAASRGA